MLSKLPLFPILLTELIENIFHIISSYVNKNLSQIFFEPLQVLTSEHTLYDWIVINWILTCLH